MGLGEGSVKQHRFRLSECSADQTYVTGIDTGPSATAVRGLEHATVVHPQSLSQLRTPPEPHAIGLLYL
jgi:hypothetical protein